MKKFYSVFLLLMIFILMFSMSAFSQFVEVKSVTADIQVRVLLETESRIVAKALKGDIFKYIGEVNDWIEIQLFTGDSRYIHKSLVEVLNRSISSPFSKDIYPQLIKSLEEAKKKVYL